MIRIIRTGLLTLLAVALFWGCSSESYPGLEYENTNVVNGETPDENKGYPIHVYVNEQSVVSLSSQSAQSRGDDATRGVGAFQTDKDDDVKSGDLSDYQKQLMQLKKDTTTFYIFAFRDKKALSAPDEDSQRLLKDPELSRWYQVEKENAPAGVDQDAQRLDCLVDGKDFYKGMRANIDDEQLLKMDRPETSPLYWSEYQEVTYGFFAYSVGDINRNPSHYLQGGQNNLEEVEHIQWGIPHRDADSIWYENFAVDGSQDLMCGYAPLLTKEMFEEGGRYATQGANLTDNELKRILRDGSYTSFAAHRNVEPEIDLKHLLTRLRFTMVAGDSTASYTTIDSVYVTSTYHGNFVVAVNSRDKLDKLGFKPKPDETTNLYLHDLPSLDKDGHLLPAEIMTVDDTDEKNIEKRTIPWEERYWDRDKVTGEIIGKAKLSDRDRKSIGDDLLIPEQEQITLVIRSTYDPDRKKHAENEVGADKREFRSRYVISAAAQAGDDTSNKYYYDAEQGKFLFRRGYIYDITMVVYGLQKIKITANIEGWKQGEDILVDPDDTGDHEFVD